MNTRTHKWRKRLVIAGVTVAVIVLGVLPAYVTLQVLVIVPYRHEHGNTYAGALAKWGESIRAGDAERAKHWADRMIAYSEAGRDRSPLQRQFGMAFFAHPYYPPEVTAEAYRCLAKTQELAGDLEEALYLYKTDGPSHLGAARVYCKMNRLGEAFHEFCAYAIEMKSAFRIPAGSKPPLNHIGIIHREIAGAGEGLASYERELLVFSDYNGFMQFMEQQWEKTGNDEQYRESMEFLRAISGG